MTITQSDNVVFILGAGASVAQGPPLMKDFIDAARRRYFERKKSVPDDTIAKDYESLFALHGEYRNSLWAVDRNWDNIEELYTQADLLRLSYYPDKETAENKCQAIAWAIWDMYRTCTPKANLGNVFDNVAATGLRPVVITTNYDLNVERSLTTAGAASRFYYPGLESPKSDDNSPLTQVDERQMLDTLRFGNGAVPILKLHGSVNWFRQDDQVWANIHPSVSRTDIHKSQICKHSCEIMRLDELNGISPAIVPPMLGKVSQHSLFAMQWKGAIKAIEAARLIYVVGYSFPQTDTFMSRLLTEGLRNNQDFSRIVVFDTQPADSHNINNILADSVRKNRLQYYQMKAQNALDIMLSPPFEGWEQELERFMSHVGRRLHISPGGR